MRVAHSQFLPVASINANRSCGNLARRIPHAEVVRRRIHIASHLSHHNAADYPSPPSFACTRTRKMRSPPPRRARGGTYTHSYIYTHMCALTYRLYPSRELPRHGITGLEDSHLPNCVPVFILRRDLFRLRDACTRATARSSSESATIYHSPRRQMIAIALCLPWNRCSSRSAHSM